MTAIKSIGIGIGVLALSSALYAIDQTLTAATAMQILGVSDPDAKSTSATWNGQTTVFVEYVIDKAKATASDPVGWDEPPSGHMDISTGERDKELRRLVAVQQTPDGQLRSTIVTDIQSDALFAGVAAIGLANADRDQDLELVVIVQWETQGGVGGGSTYQVRLFDRPDWSRPYLPALGQLSNHFDGAQFEGHTFDNGERMHARFKTIKAVQRELRRLGY